MTIEEAVVCFERQCASGICTGADKIALAALREKAEREKHEPIAREKLYELIDAFDSHSAPTEGFRHYLADYLLANGVTLLPVQVGDTVYGRFRSYGKEVHKCEVVKSRIVQFKDGTLRCFLDLEFYIEDPFYHDGRLMRCGMQAVYGADFGEWYRVYLTREEAEAQPPKGE